MYFEPNKKLLSKLDVTGFSVGDTILFCDECLWQTTSPGIGMKNKCPWCNKSPLSLSRVDDELIDLCT